MANLITTSRLILLIIFLRVLFIPDKFWIIACIPLCILVFILDAFDGYVARKFHCCSNFGAMYDVTVDRITEITLFTALAMLLWIPLWVPFVFIIRGYFVDAIRYNGLAHGVAVYDMIKSPIPRFIVAGRFMRGFYGFIKCSAIGWPIIMRVIIEFNPENYNTWSPLYWTINYTLIYCATALCILRALPVFTEFYQSRRSPGS